MKQVSGPFSMPDEKIIPDHHTRIHVPNTQVSVDDQQACYERNGYPTANVTNCCNVGFNKFKFYPSRSHGRK